jgi:hypothetical protein
MRPGGSSSEISQSLRSTTGGIDAGVNVGGAVGVGAALALPPSAARTTKVPNRVRMSSSYRGVRARYANCVDSGRLAPNTARVKCKREVSKARVAQLVGVAALLLPVAAFAQNEPKFVFGKAEEVKAVEWKAQAKGGILLTTGNSQSQNANFSASASRKAGNNKLALDGSLAYGRSNNRVAQLQTPDPAMPMMPPTITGIGRQEVTTTNNWIVRGRYDRFFTANNSGYASGQAAADKIAGKSFFGGGQAGYSRQVLKNEVHLLVAEIGYDFSYERYVQQPMKTLDPVSVHSARLFVGDTLKLSTATGFTASIEAFFNLNNEGKALNVNTGQPGVDPFKDTRLVGKAGITTTLVKSLSIAFMFTLRYDQNPAPLPIPSGSPAGAVFATGFVPFADTTDTLTDISLIYTFL